MRLPIEIESAFESGATVLTANVRAARWLRREFALRQRETGRRVWATPPIEDWDSWVLRQWQAHSLTKPDAPLVLTSLQERSVWTRMQRDDAKLLVSPEGMAALAEEAYALLCEYEAHGERDRVWGQTDAERFRQWAAAFDRECARQGWVSRARVEGLVAEEAGDPEDPALPERMVLVGFDRITPAQKRLIAALKALGTEVEICAADSAQASPKLVRATDLRDEVTACAHWIRGLLDDNPLFEKSGPMRIGVIVPELSAVRSEIERVFRRVLMPETDDVFATATRMPFEFSLGQPLGHVPVIQAALLLLRWAAGPLSEEEVSWLLLSGYLAAGDAEYLALGSFDAALRNSGSLSLEISLRDTLKKMKDARFPALADVRTRLEEMQKIAAVNHVRDEERAPGRWVDLAQVLLEKAGWREAARRDEIDFQARARWERLLDEVALLDFDGRRVAYQEFIKLLETQAAETIFATESHGAPVQVMGALESSGQWFDAVWFLGVDDQSWPGRGRLHPLLPNEVQRQTRMPHATADDDWELAKAVTERIVSSAAPIPGLKIETWGTQNVIFSHAERDKDGELRPSPLIATVMGDARSKSTPSFEWGTQPLWQRSLELLHEAGTEPGENVAVKLQEVTDASGVIPWRHEECAGGYSVIRDQAACPFRAFAARRLNAEELNRSDWGLSAAERGQLMHNVVERLWSPAKGKLHTLGDLQAAIEEGRLRAVIEETIGEVFAPLVKEHGGDAWMAAYLGSEQRRLARLVDRWLREHEAKRVPFTVEGTEKVLEDVSVGGLKLRLRADRIDRLENGERLLVDYKTGEVSMKAWEGDRPGEPQLPLYAVFGNVEDVCGVLFARINAEEAGFEGCVSDPAALKGTGMKAKLAKQPFGEELKETWANTLVNLAEDFLEGDARVDPKEGRKTCKFCDFPGLCRVAEHREAVSEEEPEPGDGDE